MWFRLFPFFLLVVYAFAQADDTITLTTIKLVDFDPLETVTFKFDWKSEAGHQLNNATLELISGRAEDKGTDVMDIIAVNVSTVDGTNAIHYKLHPGTPGGPYHARMSGTIFNGRTSLSSTTSALSNTFTVTTSSLPCAVGTWTPVRSLTDPTYSPVRLTVVTFDGELFSAPKTVFTHADISGPKAGISFSLDRVNFLFDFAEHNISVEVLNTVTGFNGGPQYLSDFNRERYDTSNFTLDPGSFKMRANLTTNSSPINPGTFTAYSDEFFVVADASQLDCERNSSSSVTSPSSQNAANLTLLPQNRWICVFIWLGFLAMLGQL